MRPPSAELVSIAVNDEVVAESVVYGSATDPLDLPTGTHSVTVTDVEGETVLLEGEITLDTPPGPNYITTAVVYDTYLEPGNAGEAEQSLATFQENLNPGPADTARVTIFNGSDEAVSLVDTGVFNRAGDTVVLESDIAPGEVGSALELPEDEYDSLRFVLPSEETADEGQGTPVFTLTERDLLRETSTLIMLLEIPDVERPTARFLEVDTLPVFGSPQAVGQSLLLNYLLPMQLVALVLLAALVGVILIAQKQVAPDAAKQSAARRPVRRRVSRPLTSVIASQVQGDVSGDAPQLDSGDGNPTQPAGD